MATEMSNGKHYRNQEQHMDEFQGMKGPATILLTILQDDERLHLLHFGDGSVALTRNGAALRFIHAAIEPESNSFGTSDSVMSG